MASDSNGIDDKRVRLVISLSYACGHLPYRQGETAIPCSSKLTWSRNTPDLRSQLN